MDVLKEVIIEMISIIIIGIVCLIIYIYGKIFFIKIGILEEIKPDESKKIKKED
tara:strand:+ start:1141 stop:1302 length:162 start_codon:yes stop_codon:yes gene_type:complete